MASSSGSSRNRPCPYPPVSGGLFSSGLNQESSRQADRQRERVRHVYKRPLSLPADFPVVCTYSSSSESSDSDIETSPPRRLESRAVTSTSISVRVQSTTHATTTTNTALRQTSFTPTATSSCTLSNQLPELLADARRYTKEELQTFWRSNLEPRLSIYDQRLAALEQCSKANKHTISIHTDRLDALQQQLHTTPVHNFEPRLRSTEQRIQILQSHIFSINDSEQEELFLMLSQRLICDDTNNFASSMIFPLCEHAADGEHWSASRPRFYRCQMTNCEAIIPDVAELVPRSEFILKTVRHVLSRQVDFLRSQDSEIFIRNFCLSLCSRTSPLNHPGRYNFNQLRQECTQRIKNAVRIEVPKLNTKISLLKMDTP